MVYYFISDLHLSGEQPATFRLLEHFLDDIATDMSHLFILGDFFDAWIGDDEDAPAAAVIKQKLRSVADKNVDCYFMHGNRDFLIGEKFAADTGFTLLDERHIIELFGKRVLLMHGDSLCIDDLEYMQFRAQVRDPRWQQNVLSMPLPQRRELAKQMRSQSQSMNSVKADDIMDVNQEAVKQAIEEQNAEQLIHGHTHRPGIHQLAPPVTRVVLGDWTATDGWYYRVDASSQALERFSQK